VIPPIASVPAALFASEHPDGSVIVTTLLDFTPVVALQPEKLPPNVTEGDAGMPVAKADGKVTVTVLPVVSAPAEEAVKPSVQVVFAPYTCEAPLKVTEVGEFEVTETCGELEMVVSVPAEVDFCCAVKVAVPVPD
jgi:hypothetical protein